jgi:hypothetical protein
LLFAKLIKFKISLKVLLVKIDNNKKYQNAQNYLKPTVYELSKMYILSVILTNEVVKYSPEKVETKRIDHANQ